MTGLSLSLVLLASVAHSTWNLLLKRSGDKEVFVWCLLAAASLLLVPLGAVLLWLNPIQGAGWWFVLATILLHILYFALLGRSYERGDLSLVYPIARGVGPMLVPGLAVVFLGETVALPAIFGIATIVAGIYILAWWGNFHMLLRRPLEFLTNSATRYAMLTGVTIAAYALVDKRGVGHVQPFLYMYLMTLGSAVGLYCQRVWSNPARVAGQLRAYRGSRPADLPGLRPGADRLFVFPSQLCGAGTGDQRQLVLPVATTIFAGHMW